MGRRGNFRNRERLRRYLAERESECWLCLGAEGPLDLSLKTPHPLSVEIDEEVPVCKGGDPLDRDGCHLVHRKCNLRKGSRILPRGVFAEGPRPPHKPTPSRKWW